MTDPRPTAPKKPTTATAQDWPAQKKPPQRRAEAHDDNLLESVGKAVSAPIEGAAESDDMPQRPPGPRAERR